MNVDVNFDIDTDDIFNEIESHIENAIENHTNGETPEDLLCNYLNVADPCGVGQTFEQAVWKAVNTRLTVEVKRILRDTLAPDPTQQEIAVAPV
jgi:HD superfamily phosphohydrolase YqeK